jgi:hypothetical protein
MRALDTIATPDIQTLVDPMNVLSVVDYGDQDEFIRRTRELEEKNEEDSEDDSEE